MQQQQPTREQITSLFNNWVIEFQKHLSDSESEFSFEAEMFMNCVLAEMRGEPIPEDFNKDFGYLVLTKRAAAIDLKLTPWAAIALVVHCSSPGTAVMYVHYLRSLTQGTDDLVDTTYIGRKIPKGFLTESSLSNLWDLQKVPHTMLGDNLLDLLSGEFFAST